MSGIGHIGEINAIDYLRKNMGMSIYIPLKDVGIDFVAIKIIHFYQVQVKTSMFQKNSYFWFDLYKSKMIYSKNTAYIFVCASLGRRQFMDKAENFFVIPSLILKRWINKHSIASKKGNKDCLNIFLYPNFKSHKWHYKNKGKIIDWTKYRNNFSFFNK
jgi:hypothetical protein